MPNPVSLTYNDFVTQIATLAVLQTQTIGNVVQFVSPDGGASQALPQAINYAELRIQRDVDFLQSVVENDSYSLTTGNNILTLSVDDFITLQTMRVTVGTASPPLLPVSKEFLQNVYNDSSFRGQPEFFAPFAGDAATTGATSQLWMVGPYPDQNYSVRLTGTVRMISLNSFNTDPAASTQYTFISAYLPDLMLMAAMIFWSGFQHAWGKGADDPAMAVSYESQYMTLLKGAGMEEARRKFQASGWTSMSQPVAATATR